MEEDYCWNSSAVEWLLDQRFLCGCMNMFAAVGRVLSMAVIVLQNDSQVLFFFRVSRERETENDFPWRCLAIPSPSANTQYGFLNSFFFLDIYLKKKKR